MDVDAQFDAAFKEHEEIGWKLDGNRIQDGALSCRKNKQLFSSVG